MGLEESPGAGLDIDDICSILKGHVPDSYQVPAARSGMLSVGSAADVVNSNRPRVFPPSQFNPAAPLHPESNDYRKAPVLKDKIHCVAYVTDATKVPIMPSRLEEKLEAIRRKVNLMGQDAVHLMKTYTTLQKLGITQTIWCFTSKLSYLSN